MLKSSTAGPSYSFTLARVDTPAAALASPPGSGATPVLSPVDSTVSLAARAPAVPPPLLTFHDRTPVMMVSTVTGLIEVDQAEEALLGVDSSFWIAVALTYLEFLQEKEVCATIFSPVCPADHPSLTFACFFSQSYLAALSD
ncbi:hypothetical protein MVEN_01663100 [Mycena venus]|uniref:Uncharacterized protein n=1 Tax=Mycena venus TaxID=2733690 RepID=A0A8H6XNG9_9AGAR|nr:hypothetical protein MVEN_01663100 [Mycena venus]